MRKKTLLLVAVAWLVCFATSCTQFTDDVADNISENSTVLRIGLEQTRTSLGEKLDKIYPIYWSEGDRIVADGVVSDAITIGDSKKDAQFLFSNRIFSYPVNITYPYTEGSYCNKERPTVVFAAEQEYMTNTFGDGYAPMCGFYEEGATGITLSHLASILRFAVKGTTTLAKIEIVAADGVALAGEFDVDCQSGALTAIEGKTSNKVTYIVDETLSESNPTYFHIAIPALEIGSCKVIFTDNKGFKMAAAWNAKDIEAGVVREFKEFSFKNQASFELEAMSSIRDSLDISESHDGIWGYVKYSDGTPAVGVAVSDGFSVVVTNNIGFYNFKNGVNTRTKYIYYSIPSDAQVKHNSENQINFFKKYYANTFRYDFTLTKIEKENEFYFFTIADTHGARDGYVARLETECTPGIKRVKEKIGSTPCYAVILGDIVCASTSGDAEEAVQATKFMPKMRSVMAPTNTGNVPVFFTMGNHDHEVAFFENPPYSDYDNFLYHTQDAFEEQFGPANYSLNRGDVHIICMRDILWPKSCITNKNSLNCYGGFLDYQVEWLRQDLANVPKSKKVILCVHIPLSSRYSNTTSYPNVKTVVDMIKGYTEPQIFSGHNHKNCDIKANSSYFGLGCPVNEKLVVGNWGTGSGTGTAPTLKCMGDGSPFGFDVYKIGGAKFKDHYYADCTSKLSHDVDTDYVMRAYLSSNVYGGDCTGDGKVYTKSTHQSHKRYFKFYDTSSDKYIHVNVFNGSPDTWTVELYVNGSRAKELTWHASETGYAWRNPHPYKTDGNGYGPFTWKGSGSGTASDPWYPSSLKNSQDWWFISYIINETGSTSSQTTNASCSHMWYGSLTSTELDYINKGKFEIRATHTEFGVTRTYKSSKIFKMGDHNGYLNYQ